MSWGLGYADLHCHPMAHLGFGGVAATQRRLFWGTPDDGLSGLACCTTAHSAVSSLFARIVDARHGCGAPDFGAWPHHETILHQQMYADWIERAYQSGLRLMCALAVHNRFLAELFRVPAGTDLRDSTAIEAQVRGMRAFVAKRDWMAIVEDAAQARAALAQDKLCVVLGVEVDSLGDWRSEGACSRSDVFQLVDRLHALGVRAVTPIHLANNAFGGPALFDDQFNCLNHFLGEDLGHRFFRIREEDPDGVEYLLGVDPSKSPALGAYIHLMRGTPRPRQRLELDYPDYRAQEGRGHRNLVGLTHRGEDLVEALMRRGMLIDVDHMSDATKDDVFAIAGSVEYPLYASHCLARELGRGRAGTSMAGVRHEGMLSRAQLAQLQALDGMVAPIAHQGPLQPRRTDLEAPTSDSSLRWAHTYAYFVDALGGAPVGIGTDFNGFAQQPGPRTDFSRSGRIAYGTDRLVKFQRTLERYRLGTRAWDFNRDGLAHYGLLPDFVRDVATVLGGDEAMEPFFRSAEGFVELWARCETRALS